MGKRVIHEAGKNGERQVREGACPRTGGPTDVGESGGDRQKEGGT